MAKTKYTGWRKKAAIAFQLLSVLTLLLSIERLVFDVLGQMWGTMLLNTMSTLCTITGILGVCISEKTALGVYAVWSFISIGLNVIIVLVYNDIGLLGQKEHYLGLVIGNDNWWRTHGINCGGSQDISHDMSLDYEGSGTPTNTTDGLEIECYISYATTETIHAAIYMALALATFVVAMMLLCSREKPPQPGFFDNEDNESFSYLSVAQWHDNQRPQRYLKRWPRYNTYDTNVAL